MEKVFKLNPLVFSRLESLRKNYKAKVVQDARVWVMVRIMGRTHASAISAIYPHSQASHDSKVDMGVQACRRFEEHFGGDITKIREAIGFDEGRWWAGVDELLRAKKVHFVGGSEKVKPMRLTSPDYQTRAKGLELMGKATKLITNDGELRVNLEPQVVVLPGKVSMKEWNERVAKHLAEKMSAGNGNGNGKGKASRN